MQKIIKYHPPYEAIDEQAWIESTDWIKWRQMFKILQECQYSKPFKQFFSFCVSISNFIDFFVKSCWKPGEHWNIVYVYLLEVRPVFSFAWCK